MMLSQLPISAFTLGAILSYAGNALSSPLDSSSSVKGAISPNDATAFATIVRRTNDEIYHNATYINSSMAIR
jgi:hypothetical protein